MDVMKCGVELPLGNFGSSDKEVLIITVFCLFLVSLVISQSLGLCNIEEY